MKIKDSIELRIADIMKANPDLQRREFDYKINVNNIDKFEFCFPFDTEAKNLLKQAIKALEFSLQDLDRIEKITMGIMGLDKKKTCEAFHIAEAIQYIAPRNKEYNQ